MPAISNQNDNTRRRFTFRATDEEMAALKEEAAACGTSVNTFLRNAIEAYTSDRPFDNPLYGVDAIRKTPLGSCVHVTDTKSESACDVPKWIQFDMDNPWKPLEAAGSIPPSTPVQYMTVDMTRVGGVVAVSPAQGVTEGLAQSAEKIGEMCIAMCLNGVDGKPGWIQQLRMGHVQKRTANKNIAMNTAVLVQLALQIPQKYQTSTMLFIMHPTQVSQHKTDCVAAHQLPLLKVGEPETVTLGGATVHRSGRQRLVPCPSMPLDTLLITDADNLHTAVSRPELNVLQNEDDAPMMRMGMTFALGWALENPEAALLVRGLPVSTCDTERAD